MARRQRRIDPKDFWTWKSKRVSWCIRCHRTIEKGDVVRFEEFYDDEGKFHAVTHNDCREVRDRARLPAPEPVFVQVGGELRRMIMDVETTTTEEQQGQETTTKRRQSRKSSGTKKSAKSAKSAKGTKAKKTSSKKSSKSNGSKTSRTPMVVTVAERLIPHFGKGKRAPAALKVMAKGETPANSDLIALRDAVNELAKKYREEGMKGEASALSATNALVRRLERATR